MNASNPVPQCLKNLRPLPVGLSWHAGATLGNAPHACGGARGVKQCFRYAPASDTWGVSGKLTYDHDTPGYTYHDDLGLIVSGSQTGTGQDKVVKTADGRDIQVPT